MLSSSSSSGRRTHLSLPLSDLSSGIISYTFFDATKEQEVSAPTFYFVNFCSFINLDGIVTSLLECVLREKAFENFSHVTFGFGWYLSQILCEMMKQSHQEYWQQSFLAVLQDIRKQILGSTRSSHFLFSLLWCLGIGVMAFACYWDRWCLYCERIDLDLRYISSALTLPVFLWSWYGLLSLY